MKNKALIVTVAAALLMVCAFVAGHLHGASSRTAGGPPATANPMRPAMPHLGATLQACQAMAQGVDTNTGWAIIGDYIYHPHLYSGEEAVFELEFTRQDAAPLTGHEVQALMSSSANGFQWLTYPLGGGRWHRSDAGAWAELQDPGNLLITTEEPSW